MIGPSDAFIWGDGGAQLTPTQIDAQRKVAQALMAQGSDYSPVQSWTQGASRVAQAIFGGMQARDANEAAKANMAMEEKLIAPYLPGGTPQPATPSVSTPMGQTSIPSGQIDPRLGSAISTVASAHPDISPEYMTRLALVENGGRVEGGSQLSSAQGPFQFLSGTAKQYGLANPNDPNASAEAAARLTLDNKAALTQALGREPTPGELYLAHQQGSGGAINLLSHPNAPVESVIGAAAARNNAAAPGMTAGQFAGKWTGKFGDIVQTVDPAQKNIIDAQADDPAALPVNAQPTQGFAIPGQAQAPVVPTINPATFAKAMPYLSPFTQKFLGGALLQQMEAARKQADPSYQMDLQLKQGQLSALPLDRQAKELAIEDARMKQTPMAPPTIDQQGNLVQTDALGKVTVLSQAPHKGPEFGVIGKDQFGNDQYGWRDPRSMSVTGPDGRPVQPTASPQATVTGPDGKQIPVPEGVDPKAFRTEVTKATADAATGKKTEVQGKAEQFANRMETAESALSGGLEKQALGVKGAAQSIAGSLPFGSSLQSGAYQRYNQAKSQFVTALLRQESGAAIGKEEFNRYDKEFFPQPGDTQEVIEQKAQSRRVAIEAMKKGAGPSYKSPVLNSTGGKTSAGVAWSIE